MCVCAMQSTGKYTVYCHNNKCSKCKEGFSLTTDKLCDRKCSYGNYLSGGNPGTCTACSGAITGCSACDDASGCTACNSAKGQSLLLFGFPA